MKGRFVELCQERGVNLASVEVRGGKETSLRIRWYQQKFNIRSINARGFDLEDAWGDAYEKLLEALDAEIGP